MIYLDANATEPLRPHARQAVLNGLEAVGNPASVHAAGRAARKLLEDARESLAARFDVKAQDVVFVSGGTEANAAAIHALGQERVLITGATEHDAVRAAAPGAAILPVGSDGIVALDELERMLRARGPALVCIMLANNETGVIQPVAEAAAVCRAHGAILHVDAVQAAGRLPMNGPALGAHSLAISSHKLGGPAGIGALLLSPDAPFDRALIAGGGQERGRRGGTPAVALAAGFAAAAVAADADDGTERTRLRDRAEQAALEAGAVVCGGAAPRLGNTTCLALPGVVAATQVMALDLAGIAVSAGAACSSGKVQSSHVLQAMGLGPLAGQAIRVSLPWDATDAGIEDFIAAYHRMAERLLPALVIAHG
jgi:cysteine desulfurase